MTALPDKRGADVLGLERLVALEHAADGVGDGARIDDGAVDDGIRRHRLDGERRDPVALAGRFQLDRLDRARPDIEPNDSLAFAKHGHLVTRRSENVPP